MASNSKFTAEMQKIAKSVDRPELQIPEAVIATLPPAVRVETRNLSKQPEFQAVEDIREAFRKRHKIDLSVYEGCEVNRWLYEDKEQNPPNGGMKWLHDYWKALDGVAKDKTGNADFMALIGALAIDNSFRFDFTEGNAPLSEIGFNNAISAADEKQLRNLLQTNSQADISARLFEAASWSGGCCAIARLFKGWTHVNT
jgi:hypothetical protein